MERKFKLAAGMATLALTTAACAPSPYYPGYNTATYGTPNTYGTTTTTVRTTGTAQGQGQNRTPVTHSHCGRTHAHVLPPEGLAHHHGDGCLAGSGGTTTTTVPNYGSTANYGGTTTTYGYGGQPQGGMPPQGQPQGAGTRPYYDYTGGTAPAAGSGNTYNYNAYVDPPKRGTGSTPGSSSDTYNYNAYMDPPKRGSAQSPTNNTINRSAAISRNTGGSGYAGGDTYVVQRGDTVFQVMRATGVYWKDIIRLNNLQAPDYTITPGQVLRLK